MGIWYQSDRQKTRRGSLRLGQIWRWQETNEVQGP